jgi:cell division transport system ATP-binding protein
MIQNVIKLESVDVYQQNHLVLSNVSLNINKGEFAYLIGSTGSGKSSLLKVLYADLHIKQGSGWVAGHDLNALKDKDVPFLRRKLGIVFQDFQLLTDRTVEQNLQFVLKATGWKDEKAMQSRILESLDNVGMRTKLKKYTHELSGGEQQRIVIARALLNHPEIILADEPTGNLDPEISAEILVLLKKISESGTAVLMATHDYHIINKFPQRIIKCQDGKVIDNAVLSL